MPTSLRLLGQKSPYPGIEPNLSELFAVGEGKAALLNVQLEPQGGRAASDLLTQPISGEFSEVCFWNLPLTNLP